MAKSIIHASNIQRQSLLTRSFHEFHIIIFFIFFFSKPAISMLERVDMLNLLVSRVGADVHGPQVIISFLLQVSKLSFGALHGVDRERHHFLHMQWGPVL